MAESFDRYAQFKVAKEKASQETNAQKQSAQDAINRRFAAMGMGNSGAAIKQQRLIEDAAAKNLNAATADINAAEQAERARQFDITDARNYQTQEREASQKYATGERLGSQEFARGERVETNAFARQMQEMQNAFAKGERISSQNFTKEQQLMMNDFNQRMQKSQNSFAAKMDVRAGYRFARQLRQQQDQFEKTLAAEKEVNEFNKQMASKKPGKNIFEKGGDLGTQVYKTTVSKPLAAVGIKA